MYCVEVAVVKKLPVPVLLGRDLPWKKLIVQQMTPEELESYRLPDRKEETYAVITRSQQRAMREAEEQQESEEADALGAATQLNLEESGDQEMVAQLNSTTDAESDKDSEFAFRVQREPTCKSST